LADIAKSLSASQTTALADLLPTDSLAVIPPEIYPRDKLAAELKAALLVISFIPHLTETLDEYSDFWFNTPALRDFLQINLHDDIYWFNKEAFEILLNVSFTISTALQADLGLQALVAISKKLTQLHKRVQAAIPSSDYQVDRFQDIVSPIQHQSPDR
jgi:hypothetical protein